MKLPAVIAAAIALSACSGSKQPEATESGAADITDGLATDDASPLPDETASASQAAIPAALRGRWGLVPADCTSTRGDAKGLVTIDASTMRFYESVATLKTVETGSDQAIRASFAYSGEGMEWSRRVSLAAKGGSEMTMEEFGGDAPAGARTYTRCG